MLPQSETEDIKLELDSKCADNKNGDYVEELQYLSPKSWDMDEPFLQFSDVSADQDVADDQFFDVSVGHEFDQSESLWPSNDDMQSQVTACYKLNNNSVVLAQRLNYVFIYFFIFFPFGELVDH